MGGYIDAEGGYIDVVGEWIDVEGGYIDVDDGYIVTAWLMDFGIGTWLNIKCI